MTPSAPQSLLILGGARSGKSAYAEDLCEQTEYELHYIATSPRFENDAEMQQRIQHHRERRGPRWTVHEEEIELTRSLETLSKPGRAILVDCLTLWLNNLIYRKISVEDQISSLSSMIGRCTGPVIFISNEIGQGVVPLDRDTRYFRDEHGKLNQIVAKACSTVIEVKAGLPIQLKPSLLPPITL